MDETSKEIAKDNLGITITGTDEAIGSLIWVDDVIVADIEEKRFQRMLNMINRIAQKYHIENGAPKSNVMKISRNKNKPKFIVGNRELEYTDNYKYLAFMESSINKMKDHLQTVKEKTEAAHQMILILSGNTSFKNVEIESI